MTTKTPRMGEVLAMLTNKPLIELWVTEVGSQMWGMETFASDHDFITIYVARHYDTLTGYMTNTLPQKTDVKVDWLDKPLDVAGMEIGHLIHLLKKGNVNAIWAVMSPQIVSNIMANPFHRDHVELRRIVKENVSAQTYYSVKGMAVSQLADVEKRAGVRSPEKSLASAMRTIRFGIRLLEQGEIYIEQRPSKTGYSEGEVRAELDHLDMQFEKAVSDAILPPISAPKPFDDYLFNIREKIAHTGDYYLAIQKQK